MDTVLLYFTVASPPYRAGEVAGFTAEEAVALLERKVARRVERAEADRIHAKTIPARAAGPEELVVVRFNRAYPPYIGGELAGFSAAEAQRLLEPRTDGPPIAAFVKQAPMGPIGLTFEKEGTKRRGGAETAPPATDLISLQFLRSTAGYRRGEVAGFPPDVAEQFVRRGDAVAPEDWPKGKKGPAAPVPAAGDPPAETVAPGTEVLGLDDRNPDWRDQGDAPAVPKAPAAPEADKMVKRPPRAKRPPGTKAGR